MGSDARVSKTRKLKVLLGSRKGRLAVNVAWDDRENAWRTIMAVVVVVEQPAWLGVLNKYATRTTRRTGSEKTCGMLRN